MGQDTTGRAATPLEAGLATFEFARRVTDDLERAVTEAIASAVVAAHRGFVQATRDDILEKAVDLSNEEDNDINDDGVASLIWYAQLLDETLPPDYRLGVSS